MQYHEGFRSQANRWPLNPVNVFIEYIEESLLKKASEPLKLADMGCGDALIARHFENNNNIIVSSYDLVKKNEFVTAADISKINCPPGTFDIVVFCLSLMGSNYHDFLKEAHRILKPK